MEVLGTLGWKSHHLKLNGLFYGDLDKSVERAVQIIEACLVEFIEKQKLCQGICGDLFELVIVVSG